MRTLRFIIGAAAGFLVWWYGALIYNGALSFAAERVLRLDSRLCNPQLVAVERRVEATPHLCVAPKAEIPADQLTYNMILFAALFAMRFRSFESFFACLAILIISHALSLAITVESTYAGKLGAWSDAHFDGLEQDVWTAIEFWWRLVGMFALVFAMWWVTLAPTFQPTRASAAPRPKRAAGKGRR